MSTSVPPPGFVSPEQPRQAVPPPDPDLRLPGRRWKLAAVAAPAAIALAAFLLLGGGGSGGGSALGGPVAQAATVSSGAAGYRMRMSFQIETPASPSPITASGSGVVDLRDHATAMSIAMNFGSDPQVTQALGGSTLRMRMVMTGGDIYMKVPAVAAITSLTSGKPWLKLNLVKLAGIPGLSSLESNPTTSDPSQMLQYLRSTSDVVLDEGHQMVDGRETTHYQAEVNLDGLLGKLGGPAQQAAAKLKQLLPSGDLPIDVWIDPAHLVRRIAMTLSLGAATGPSVRETVTADLSDYGPQPQPSPPPADQVQDLSSLASAG